MYKKVLMTIVATIAGVNVFLMNFNELDVSAHPSWCNNSSYNYFLEQEAKYQQNGVYCGYNQLKFDCSSCGQSYCGCQPLVGTVTEDCVPTKCSCKCK